MNEIDFKKAEFDDIDKFTKNLLTLQRSNHPQDYDAQIAYFTTSVHALLGRRMAKSATELAVEIDAARSGVARGLEKLSLAIGEAIKASSDAATAAETQARRMVKATWGLVVATGVLAIVTVALVVYTRALAAAVPLIVNVPK